MKKVSCHISVSLAVLMTFHSIAHAQTDITLLKSMTLDEARAYHQDKYLLDDVEGDFALRVRTFGVFNKLMGVMSGSSEMNATPLKQENYDKNGIVTDKELHEDINAKILEITKTTTAGRDRNLKIAFQKNRLLKLEGKKNPFDLKGFTRLFAQIFREEEAKGLRIMSSPPHVWSKEIQNTYPIDMVIKFPKILVALASGYSSYYMMTGTEEQLTQKVLTQPYDSITFEWMFRTSLQINHGDVYLSLLTIENILSKNWRVPNREFLPITRRLKPIQNSWNEGGDRYGTWYHFVGTMLYGFAHGKNAARFAGWVEGLGSQILSNFEEEAQENFANMMGGLIGDDLANLVNDKKYQDQKNDEQALLETTYLKHQEDYRARLEIGLDPNLKVTAGTNGKDQVTSVWVRHLTKNLGECKLEVALEGSANVKSLGRHKMILRQGTVQNISLSSTGSKTVRVFLTECTKASGAYNTRAKIVY